MSIIIKQGCNKPQIWNITELVNIEQLTKMDNERGKRLDLRWWSNYVEVSVKLVISGLRMNGFSRMICQLVKLPLGEQCLSSWRRGLGTRRLSTSTPSPSPHTTPKLGVPFWVAAVSFPTTGLGGSRNTISEQLAPSQSGSDLPNTILYLLTQKNIVPP